MKYMNNREASFVKNYHIFGEGTAKIYGFKKKEAEALKQKYKEKGVFLLPDKNLAAGSMSTPKKKNKNTFGAVQFAIASLAPPDQEKIVAIAKNMPEPAQLMDQTIAIQEYRVQVGLKNEYEQGKLLDSTEAAIGNLVNMIQAKNNIEEGQEVNLNINNSVSSLLDEIEENEKFDRNDKNEIVIDPTKEQKKQQLKEIRSKSINDILDEAKK